jgi:hypothetical protein
MANPNQNINQGKKDLKEISEIVGALDDGFQSLADRITGVVDEIKDANTQATIFSRVKKDINSTLNSISRASERLIKNEIELATGQLSSKKIQKEIVEITAKKNALTQRLTNLINKENDGYKLSKKEKKEITNLQKEIITQTAEVEDNLQRQLETTKQQEQKLGNTGKLLKGISKIPVLGNFLDAEKALIAAQQETAREGSNRVSVMNAAFKSLGTTLKESVSDPLTQITLALKFFQTATKYALEFNDTQIKLQRALLISSENAKSLANNMQDFAQASNNAYVNYVKLAEANIELNNALGTNVQLTAKQLEDSIELKEAAGLEVDEREAIYKLSLLTGKTQENIFNSIGKQNKGVLSNKKVLSEVLKVSGQLAAQYKNNPELLGKAVVQAQKLGMTLEQTKNISKQLLNFEDSIAAELEAELLTGIDLNLEKARYLALQGDSAGAAQELMKNLGPNGLLKFQKMNTIQQESIARALGMGVDELADSLVKEKQLAALDGQQRKLIAEAKQKLIDQGKIEEAQAFEKNILASKNVDLALLERTEREQTAESIENLKKSFFSLTSGPITSIIKSFNNVLEMINNSPTAKMLIGIAGGGAALIALGVGLISSIKLLSGIFSKGAIPVSIVGGGGGIPSTGNSNTPMGPNPPTNYTPPNTPPNPSSRPPGRGLGSKFKNLFKGGKLLKGLGKKIPYAGAAIGLISQIAEGGLNMESLGRASLSGGGAFLGGLLGTIGGLGAASVPLGIAGGIGGGIAGDKLGDLIFGERKEYATGGIVSKPTRALIGEAGTEAVIPLDKFYAKLDELINVAKTGGNVYIDSTKAGTAFGIGTYKTQ